MILTSCENFLNGGETARQIQEAIEIANSDPTTIYIEAEKDSGTVTPPQVKVKKKESFDLRFNPADDWKFIAWEVLDRTSGEVLDDVIKFDDASKLSVTGTLLKPTENLLIRPKSLRLPSIVSVTPAFPEISYSNATITVNFNMPMEPEYITQDSSLFRYGPQNISITCGSDDMKEYFEVPEFNTSKTTLTLTPKSSKLSSFIQSLNKPFADIQISFGENITLVKDGVTLTLAQDKRNLFVRYKADIETTPPTKYEFYATNDLESGNHFTQAALSVFGDSEILKNRTDGKIYIYGRYYDADSGVQSVKLTEKHTNAKDGSLAPVTYEPEIFTASNADSESGTFFTDDGNGTTIFCIEYNLKSDDGAVLITLAVSDACGNPAEEQSFTAIKDSGLDLSGVELYNLDFLVEGDGTTKFFTLDGTGNTDKISYDDYPTIIKEVKLKALNKPIYGTCHAAETDMSVVLSYKNNLGVMVKHNMVYDSTKNRWSYTLNDVTDISSLELKLIITDDYNHTTTKDFVFPDMPNLVNLDFVSHYGEYNNNDAYDLYNVFFSTQSKATNLLSSPEFLGGNEVAKVCYITSEDSLATSMYSNRGSYRFALLNHLLAGPLTPGYTTNDRKTENASLPPVIVKEASMAPSAEGEYLDISITVDTSNGNPWNIYDSIIAQHSLALGQKIIVYIAEKNSLTINFSVPFDVKRYFNTNFVKLIGFTSTEVSPAANYDWYYLGTPSNEPEKFDIRKPTANNWGSDSVYAYSVGAMYKSIPDIPERYDYMMPCAVVDYETGIKKIEVNTNGCYRIYDESNLTLKELLYDLGDNVTHSFASDSGLPFIPVWDADKELNNLRILFYDAQNNCLEYNGSISFIKVPSFSIKDGSTNTFVSDEIPETLYRWRLGIVKLNASANTWSKASEITTTPTTSTGTNGGKIYTYSNVSLPSNTFVKVVATAALEDSPLSVNYGNSAPLYFYTGSIKNSRDYDYILNNGSSKSTALVASDAPTFVHTLVTKRSLSECQDWTVDEWEHNHKHIGDKYMDFSTNPTAKKYTIPVGLMDSGDCYVVIAHFADGTSTMSQVWQN